MKKTFTLFLAFIIVCIFKITTATAQVNVQDSLALVDFYDSTDGTNWQPNNWLTADPVSTWTGVTVSNNRVTEIIIGGIGTYGHIPSSFGNLTALKRFSASYGITGTLPSTIGNLTSLESLAIFFCHSLTGPLPSTLGNLSNLRYLYFYSDNISGTIPSSLGNLSNLKWLYLAGNQLTGNIPASLNNLTNLDTLDLSFNLLSGTVPDLTGLHNLNVFSLRTNKFTFAGMESIASNFPFANYQNQRSIPINNNNNVLSVSAGGTLANNTYKWYKGSTLVATINGDSTYQAAEKGYYHAEINNSVATGLTLVSDSVYVDLNTLNTDSLALVDFYNSTNGPNWQPNNWLTAAPLSTWTGVTVSNKRVTEISVGNIGTDGPIPSSFGNLTALISFSAEHGIKGPLPSSLGNLVSLQSLSIYFCDSLTGHIPDSFGNLSNLTNLYLVGNSLTGSIPSSLGNLSKLKFLYLGGNPLTGSIPASLNNLYNLKSLDVSVCKLSGAIPPLDQLDSLSTLSLGFNKFTFAGMEQIALGFPFATYSPQAIIPLHENLNKLSVSAGGYLPNLTFRWYKDGNLYKTITGDSTLNVTENGRYSVTVNDQYATQLTLYSDSIFLGVLANNNVNFTAVEQNNQALLKWSTTQETNTSYFTIERSSNDINFTAIGKVMANENSIKNNYSFTDDLSNISNQTSVIYYRLKTVDKDGVYLYSEIRNIKLNDNLFANLYPNPAKENTKLSFTATGKYSITITDGFGKVLQTESGFANNSLNNIQLNVNKYASGIYFVTITDDKNKKQTLRLNKE